MKSSSFRLTIALIVTLALSACVTTKSSKKETGWLKTKVHDMNARYNGIFNAKELYKESITMLTTIHEDDYNQVLEIYPYGTLDDRKLVEENMDLAIEKVVKVSSLHEPSKWVDDCYVIMGKAQYLKGDYESAQETFEYFVEDFNPKDPTSRVYKSPERKETSKDRKKNQLKERKIQQKEREKVREEKEKTRQQVAKERKKERKKAEKERKQRNKDRKKGIKTTPAPKVEKPKEVSPVVTASTDNEVPVDEDEAYVESLLEAEQKAKNAKIEDGYTGGFLKHKPAYYEGMFWLAKTFIAREKWVEANYFLDQLENEPAVLDKVKEELPIVRADYFLQQKDYGNATEALVYAMDNTSDRMLKARMSFILAQAYQMNGQAAEAQKAFAAVKKYKTTFEMELNAELNQLKNSWAAGTLTSDQVTRKLERIGKQDKNRNHLGAIYLSIAEVKIADGDQVGAMEYFQKALVSSANNTIKSDIYYRLGTLFFAKEDFANAKLYYDSTLVVMDEKDPRFKTTTRYSESLRDIAKNMAIISTQDSLLRLGSMSESQLEAYAKNIATNDWREKQAKETEAQGGFQTTTSVFSADSKFFAYNEIAKQKGKRDFIKRWGDRPLEDNWRRSQKSSSVFDQEELGSIEQVSEMPEKELEQAMERILSSIPNDAAAKEKSNATIEKAMFELGTGLRTSIENYKRSNDALLKLIKRYPSTKNKAEAYYFIYLNYIDLGDEASANNYKALLISEFPNNSFAKYLKNPSSGNALITEEREIEMYYEDTYRLFEKGAYTQAQQRIVEANKKFGNKHDMMAKYELLKAMCIGNTEGQDAYVNALRGVILRFDGTDEQTYARELMRFLKGDEETFDANDTSDEALAKYVKDDDKLHYVLVVLYDSDGQLDPVKDAINDFNSKRFSEKRLRVTSLTLNKKTKTYMFLIRRFTGKDDAMVYYRDASTRLDQFVDPKKYSYDIYAVNQKNYRKIIEENKVGAYRSFFDKHYLGIGK